MILFSDRLKLAKLYKEWLRRNTKDFSGPTDCAENVITFLHSIETLNEDKVKEVVKDVEI